MTPEQELRWIFGYVATGDTENLKNILNCELVYTEAGMRQFLQLLASRVKSLTAKIELARKPV